jgi:rhodanese-related sulfurtransferase
MSILKTISTDGLRSRLATPERLELWNVLTDEYFKHEMIPGSRRVPVDQVGREVARSAFAKDTPIVVYCAGPSCPASRQAAEKLVTLGFMRVLAYEGGLEEWKAAGQAIEQLAIA